MTTETASALHFASARKHREQRPRPAHCLDVAGGLEALGFRIWELSCRVGEAVLVRARVSGPVELFVYDPDGDLVGQTSDSRGPCIHFMARRSGAYFLVLSSLQRREVSFSLRTGSSCDTACPDPV